MARVGRSEPIQPKVSHAVRASVFETTLDAAGGSFWSGYNPHTTASITVPAGALAVVESANQNLHASNAFTVTNSGTARTWTRLTSYAPATDHLVVDYWYNNTGAPVSMTITVTYVNGDGFNDNIMSWVGVIAHTADPAVTPPRIVTTISNTSTAQATGTPSAIGSLFCLHYYQNAPTANVSSLVAGSAVDASPVSTFYFSGGPCSIGTIHQSAVNVQTASSVTVGATLPTTAQTYGFLVEYFLVSASGPLVGTPADPEGITDTATPVQVMVRTQADAEGILDSASPVQNLVRSVGGGATGFIAAAHQVPTGATMNLALPAGAVLNGYCLVVIGTSSSTAISDAIAGSTVILSAPANNMYLRVLAKQLTATDISNGFLVVTGTVTSHDFWILAYDTTVTGFDSSNSFPLGPTAYDTRNAVSQTFVTAPSITPNSSGDLVVLISAERTTATGTTVASIGQGTQDYYNEDTVTTNVSLLAAHYTGPASGVATSTDTVTYSGASGNAIAFLLPMTTLVGTSFDLEGITDAAVPVQDLVRPVADPVGLLDTAVAQQDFARLPADPVGLLDTASIQQGMARTAVDPVGLLDTATPVQGAVRQQDDAVGVTDAVSATLTSGYTRSQDDPVGLVDTASAVLNAVRQQDDPLGIVDTATAQQALARTTTDAVGLLDTASAKQDVVRAQADAVGLLDTTTATQDLVRPPADPAGIVDAATVVQSLARAPADPEGITDSATASLSMPRQVDDPIGLTDTASTVTGLQRAPADPVGIIDSVSATLTTAGAVTVADQLGLTDSASAKIDSVRSTADQIGLADTATAGLGFIRTAVDPVGLSDTAAATQQAARTTADAIAITDALVLARALPMDDPTALTDTVTASLGMNRETDDDLGLTDSVTAFLDRVRTQGDPVGITDSVTAVLTPAEIDYAATPSDVVGITDSAVAVLVRGEAPKPVSWHDTQSGPLIPSSGVRPQGTPWHDTVSGGLIPRGQPQAQPGTPPWRDESKGDLIPGEETE